MSQIEGNVKVNVNANQSIQQLNKLEKEASELRKEIIRINKQDVIDSKKLKVLNQELRSVTKEQKSLRQSAVNYKTVLQNLSGASLKNLNKAYRQLSREVNNLNRNTKEWKQKAEQLGRVKSEISSVRAKMRAMDTSVQKSKKGIGGLADKFNKFGGMALGAIAGVTASITGLVMILKKMINIMTEFEDSFTNVLTLLSGDEINEFGKKLEEGSINIMRKYGLEATDVNKALFDTISAGVDAASSIKVLDAAAILSTGGVTTLSTATDGLTTVMNAFHLSTDEATNVANAFFTAQKYGKTTVAELATNVGTVAPIMNAAGLKYQEMLAVLAELTKNGISTAESTTYLKGTITSLMKPTAEAAKVLKEYGVPVGATEIKQAGLTKTLAAFNDMMAKNPDVVAKAMPNIRGLTGVMALSGDSFEDFQKILDKVNNDLGDSSSLMQAYGIKANTASMQMKKAGMAMKTNILQLRKDLMPALITLTVQLASISKHITKFIAKNPNTLRNIGFVIDKLWSVLSPIRSLRKAIDGLSIGFEKLFKHTKKANDELSKTNQISAKQIANNLTNGIGSNISSQYTSIIPKVPPAKNNNSVIPPIIDEDITPKKDNTKELADYIKNIRKDLLIDAEEKALAEVEIWREKEQQKIKSMVAGAKKKNEALGLIEEQYQKKIANIEKKHDAEREKKVSEIVSFIKKQESSLAKTKEELEAKDIAKISEKYDTEIALAQKLANDNPAIRSEMLDRIAEMEELKANEINQYKLDKEIAFQHAIQQTREQYNLISDAERMQLELEQLQDAYDLKLLKEEEFQTAKNNIIQKYKDKEFQITQKTEKNKWDSISSGIENAQKALNIYSTYFQNQKQKEIDATNGNEKEILEIKKRYALSELEISISNIIANTALAITKTIAELGGVGALTPAGIATISLVTANGIVQLGAARTQYNQVMGLAKGGLFERAQDGRVFKASHTSARGLISKPSVLVAEEGPEYVVPNEGLQNPSIMNFLSMIEMARINGQLREFRMPKIQGYAEGGIIGATPSASTSDFSSEELSVIISKLDVLISGTNEMYEKIDGWASNLTVDYYSFRTADETIKKIETKANL